MKQKLWILLAAVLLALLCCGAAVAETTTEIFDIKSGSCGENVIWTQQWVQVFVDGTMTQEYPRLVISGEGPMHDYELEGNPVVNTPWYDFSYSFDEVIIEPGVTSIGRDAFRGTDIKRVTIADTVTRIARSAFESCSSLTEITIPDSVVSIGQQAFRGCDFLKSAVIGDGVREIGMYTFENCSRLQYVGLGHSMNLIDRNAFSGCGSIIDIFYHGTLAEYGGIRRVQAEEYDDPLSDANVNYWTLVDGTLTVGKQSVRSPFENTLTVRPWADRMDSIHEIVIEGDVQSIPEGAFEGFEGLTDLTIRSNVGNIPIEKRAFADCENLAHVTLEDVGTIGE